MFFCSSKNYWFFFSCGAKCVGLVSCVQFSGSHPGRAAGGPRPGGTLDAPCTDGPRPTELRPRQFFTFSVSREGRLLDFFFWCEHTGFLLCPQMSPSSRCVRLALALFSAPYSGQVQRAHVQIYTNGNFGLRTKIHD